MKARAHTIKATSLVAFTSLILLVAAQAPAQVGPGSALAFDGVDDWVDLQSAVIPASGDFTVECWVYCASPTGRYSTPNSAAAPAAAQAATVSTSRQVQNSTQNLKHIYAIVINYDATDSGEINIEIVAHQKVR